MIRVLYDNYYEDIKETMTYLDEMGLLEKYHKKFIESFMFFHNIKLPDGIDWLKIDSYVNLLPINELSYVFFIVFSTPRLIKNLILDYNGIRDAFTYLYSINKQTMYNEIINQVEPEYQIYKIINSLTFTELEEYINCLYEENTRFQLKTFFGKPINAFLKLSNLIEDTNYITSI